MWYLLGQDCVRRDGEGSRGVAKQSQMRALLTIGKMGKRFQENETLRRYRSLARAGVGWASPTIELQVGDTHPTSRQGVFDIPPALTLALSDRAVRVLAADATSIVLGGDD